jgi:hypothetical protein
MPPLAFTDARADQDAGYQLPRALRSAYLRRVAELLAGRDFGDGDVHRAALAAAGEIMLSQRKAG